MESPSLIPGTAHTELNRREFTRGSAAFLLLLVASGGRSALQAAQLAAVDPRLQEELLLHCLEREMRGGFAKTTGVLNRLAILCAEINGTAATAQSGLRHSFADLARRIEAAPESLVSASDLLSLAHLSDAARASLERCGYADGLAGELAKYVARQMDAAPDLRAALRASNELAQALPALRVSDSQAALLQLAAPVLQKLLDEGQSLAGKSTAEIEANISRLAQRTLVGQQFDVRRASGVDRTSAVATRLAEARQALALSGPLLSALGVAPAEVARIQAVGNLAINVALVCYGGPLTLTGAVSLLGSINGVLGAGAPQSDQAMELIHQALREICERLQRIEQNQVRLMEMLARFAEDVRGGQAQILAAVTALGNQQAASLEILLSAARAEGIINLRRATEQTLADLHEARKRPNDDLARSTARTSAARFIATIKAEGAAVPMLATMSVPRDAFALDARSLAAGTAERLSLFSPCEFHGPTADSFSFAALQQVPAGSRGSSTNPVMWMEYVSALAEVALAADAAGVLPLDSPEAREKLAPALALLEEAGRPCGAWFDAVGSLALADQVAREIAGNALRPERFKWLARAIDGATEIKLYGGPTIREVNPASQPGHYFARADGSWRQVADNPVACAQERGILQLIAAGTAQSPDFFPTGQSIALTGRLVFPAVQVFRLEAPGLTIINSPTLAQDIGQVLGYRVEQFHADAVNKVFWRFRDGANQLVSFEPVFAAIEELVRGKELLTLAPAVAGIVARAVSRLDDDAPERVELLHWMQAAMLGNLCLSVRLWRLGIYGASSPLVRDGRSGAALSRGTPFPYGHRDDLIFSPRVLAEAAASTLETGRFDPALRSYQVGGEPLPATTLGQFVATLLPRMLAGNAEDYLSAHHDLPEPGHASIPPIELGFAKIGMLRQAAGLGGSA